MKKLKVIALTAAVMAMACSTVVMAEEKEDLIIATEAGFAPYEYMKGDQIVGVDIDIAQAIADDMGRNLVIQNMDFDAALLAVQQGMVDFAIAGISVNEEREEAMDFSDRYVDSTEVVVVNKENPMVEAPTSEALKDKIVAVQQGNIADIWVSNPDNAEPAEVVRYTKFAMAAEDLKNDKVDCIIMDELPAQDLVSQNPELMILEGDPLFQDQYAIAVQKGNQEMLDEINKVIAQLKEEGKIDEFIANHTQTEATDAEAEAEAE